MASWKHTVCSAWLNTYLSSPIQQNHVVWGTHTQALKDPKYMLTPRMSAVKYSLTQSDDFSILRWQRVLKAFFERSCAGPLLWKPSLTRSTRKALSSPQSGCGDRAWRGHLAKLRSVLILCCLCYAGREIWAWLPPLEPDFPHTYDDRTETQVLQS